MAAHETNCVDIRCVHVLFDESCHPSWVELFGEFRDLQEHEIRKDSKFIQNYSEVGSGTSLMDEISIVS